MKQQVKGCYLLIFHFPQVNNALIVDRTKNQWVDLGIHTEACMTRPETCGAEGGAISLWIRVIDCPNIGGLVSSLVDSRTRFCVYCDANSIW